MSNSHDETRARQDREKSAWWRAVLGEYPTGVTAITSTGSDGEPIGMVVGTFTAVSEHPPLIGFLPANDSRTFAEIRRNGTFCANVLGYTHETLCRRFASRSEDRFASTQWETSELGNPRLADAVAWGRAQGHIPKQAKALTDSVSAVSVGIVDGVPMTDLAYVEDVRAGTDMNVVVTGSGDFVEVQGTAEGVPFTRAELDVLLDLALVSAAELRRIQREALGVAE